VEIALEQLLGVFAVEGPCDGHLLRNFVFCLGWGLLAANLIRRGSDKLRLESRRPGLGGPKEGNLKSRAHRAPPAKAPHMEGLAEWDRSAWLISSSGATRQSPALADGSEDCTA